MGQTFRAIRQAFQRIYTPWRASFGAFTALVYLVLGFGFFLLTGIQQSQEFVVGFALVLLSFALTVVHYAEKLQLARVIEELRTTREQLQQQAK